MFGLNAGAGKEIPVMPQKFKTKKAAVLYYPYERWYTVHSWDPFWPPEQPHPIDRKPSTVDIFYITF